MLLKSATRSLRSCINAPVTLFVGENGSGKSTLLEGIAAAAELRAIGGSEIALDDSLAPQRNLGAALRLSWSVRSRQGFFLRAEDFFGHLRRQARNEVRRHHDERDAARYVGMYDARSHGESFMDLFTTSVRPGRLYLLDEPEAPLSPRAGNSRCSWWCSGRPMPVRSS